MFLPSELPIQKFWKYVDESNRRDLNLAYPTEIIKALKNKFYQIKDKGFIDLESLELVVPYHNAFMNGELEPFQSINLTPNAIKALRDFFKNRAINDKGCCPSTSQLVDILLDSDKYFSMMISINREGPTIYNLIKIGEYRYASILIGELSSRYGIEIIPFLNEYFRLKPLHNKNGQYCHYFITHNRAYLISNEAYVGIMIFECLDPKYKIEDSTECIYENYDIMVTPDPQYRVKPTGSFLEDCKAIARLKREIFVDRVYEVSLEDSLSNANILEFHDLIRYGYYSDKIVSMDVLKVISNIFNHGQWVNSFLLSLALCCGKLIKIDDKENEENNDVKSLIDPTRVENFDLFVKVVKYLDSIYDELIIKPEDK